MNKIKIVGTVIFILSLALAILSHYISEQNGLNSNILKTINQQKAFTQEISKNIFYIYKNKNHSTTYLDKSINNFINNMNQRERRLNEIKSLQIKKQSDKILKLWNKFYLDVQIFRDQIKIPTPYSGILLEKTIKRIYNTNLFLVIEFNKLMVMQQEYFQNISQIYKVVQYILFIFMSILLIYFFTQIKPIIAFMQKFLQTSKKVLDNSTISDLEPIQIKESSSDIKDATNNFNLFIENIDKSIKHAYTSIDYTSNSLKQIENNIEEFLIVLNDMNENQEIDIQMTKKEDAVIQSLDELMNLSAKLDNLKMELENLIKNKK